MDQFEKLRWWNRYGHLYWVLPLVVIPPLLLFVLAPHVILEAAADAWRWLQENALLW